MDERTGVKNHKVQFSNRKQGQVTGVVDVVAFDPSEILLETEMGNMQIKGRELHVKRLSLERGEVELEGELDSFIYVNDSKNKKNREGVVARLFK